MSGRRWRSQDPRTERGIVNALLANGIAAGCAPLSGVIGSPFAGDIVRPLLGRDLCAEVKVRPDVCWRKSSRSCGCPPPAMQVVNRVV
jgi:hypothetical protein